MKFVLIAILIPAFLLANEFEIKSLRSYNARSEVSFPVIAEGEQLTIEFDVKAEQQPLWKIIFRFCDRDWTVSQNIFLINQGFNTENNLWFDKLPNTAGGADYRYSGNFPNSNVTFPFSGKWKYFITDSYDTTIVYSTGRFFFVKNLIPLEVRVKPERLEGMTLEESTFGQVLSISTSFSLPEKYFERFISQLEIIENKKILFPVIIHKTDFTDYKYFESDGFNTFNFVAKNIQPGNEYRQTNLMDRFKHKPPLTFAHYDGIEVSRIFDYGGKDFNGGSKLLDYKDIYSEYMDVLFQIRPPIDFNDEIFLTGAFNDWDISYDYMMKENNGLYSIQLELKRGIYDYQYAAGKIDENNNIIEIDWLKFEGNSWRTSNEYNLFLFYSNQDKGGFDEIIGHKRIEGKK